MTMPNSVPMLAGPNILATRPAVGGTVAECDDPRSTHAAGSASKVGAARLCKAMTQPAADVIACAMGANKNCPNDPPALTTPVAMPRRLGDTSRVVAAISTDGPAM